ncbi:MAG: hypothetical protein KTR30_11965 [Saprospiraceae bacterium]|nr:hypothetical protein [Saprospiraceae bacterium]
MNWKHLVVGILCLLGGTITGIGQNDVRPAQITWGEELREPAGSKIEQIITAGSWGSYVLRRKQGSTITGEQIFLEQYDGKMKLKRSTKVDLRYKGKKREFENVVSVGGQLYLLTSFNNEAKKKNYLFAQELTRQLTPRKTLQLIGEIDTRSKFKEGKFDLSISRDSSKVLVYNQLPYKKNEPERFALRVFNNKFEELWQQDVTLPYGDGNFGIEEYRIDRDGNVYLLGVIYEDRSRVRRNGKPTYNYTVLAYTEEGERAQEYRIDLENEFITDLTFRVANNGNLTCAGFYSNKGTYSIKGTCFFQLDVNTKEIASLNLMAFDFDFLTEYMTPGGKNRAERAEVQGKTNRAPELYRYSLDDLILRSDGGAVLVAEQYYVYQQSYYYWDGSLRYDHYYNYNDVIVVNIQPDGVIEWATRIPKRQETVNDGGFYSSYAMATVRDRFYFIYNDNSRNYQRTNRNRRNLYNFNGRFSVVVVSEIQKDGQLKTFPLFTNRDADVITRPKFCKQNGSRKMMVYGEIGRNYRFANLEFDP